MLLGFCLGEGCRPTGSFLCLLPSNENPIPLLPPVVFLLLEHSDVGELYLVLGSANFSKKQHEKHKKRLAKGI
ncbi:hypothetical protein BHM03_00027110 [Ensete ventricosum]|nr:hypothetical protein BHM03_00027110 [Ensete ventricosum]